MRRTTLALSISLIVGSLALSGQAMAETQQPQPQGLYSANDITNASVYLEDDTDEAIGEVGNILLDEEMRVQAIVIVSGSTFGLGGREIVIDEADFRLVSDTDDAGRVTHRVLVTASAEEVQRLPEYNEQWWNQAQRNAAEAWERTREGAESAWQRTRDTLTDN